MLLCLVAISTNPSSLNLAVRKAGGIDAKILFVKLTRSEAQKDCSKPAGRQEARLTFKNDSKLAFQTP